MTNQSNLFEKSENNKLVNVASVPQRSPFRYPGGKTWFIPTFRQWMSQFNPSDTILIEPFMGGGIVSLTTAFENMAKDIVAAELDQEVGAVWSVILSDNNQWLADKIFHFDLNFVSAKNAINKPDKSLKELAFATILKNRLLHGGIITKGSGFIKKGENGKGLTSRWYPKTLQKRILDINQIKHKIQFNLCDAFQIIQNYSDNENAVFFIDPPYTIAGRRLYTHYKINHEELFKLLSQIRGKFLITYDNADEVRAWAAKFGMTCKDILMKTTHHRKKYELLISNSFN